MIKQSQTGNQAEAATYYGQIEKQTNIIEKSNYISFYWSVLLYQIKYNPFVSWKIRPWFVFQCNCFCFSDFISFLFVCVWSNLPLSVQVNVFFFFCGNWQNIY